MDFPGAARWTVLQRLDNLMADPVGQEVGEPELIDYIERQCDRLTDATGATGAPVDGVFEAFRPAVKRRDAWLESPVDAAEANHMLIRRVFGPADGPPPSSIKSSER